jgi:hypothetical protein
MRIHYVFLHQTCTLAALLSLTVVMADVQSAIGQEAGGKTVAAETVSVFDKGKMKVPPAFKRTKPGPIVQHEFKVGEGEKTARLTMMGASGGIEPNIKRWKGQFSGGDEAAQKTEKMKAGPWDIYLVDLNGSFAERMGGGPFAGGKMVQRKGYAMAGAILAEPECRLYFVKMVGPEEVVKANREKFVEMIKSIGE